MKELKEPMKMKKRNIKNGYMISVLFQYHMNSIKVDIPESEYLRNIESQTILSECMNGQPIFCRLRRVTENNIRKDLDIATPKQEDCRRILVVSITFYFYLCAYAFREIIRFDYNILSKRLKPPTSWEVEVSDRLNQKSPPKMED